MQKVVYVVLSSFLLACCVPQHRNNFANNIPEQPESREKICGDLAALQMMSPTRTGSVLEGLANAQRAKAQCLLGQQITQPNIPAQQLPDQGLHTYILNGVQVTCNTFGTTTTCN